MQEKLKFYYHESWADFIDNNTELINHILNQVDNNKTLPEKNKIFKILEMDNNSIKGIIVGMDIYPQRNIATGKAFQVGGLENWQDKFRQTSLRNILRLVYKNKNEIHDYCKIPKYLDIVEEIKMGKFQIDKPFDLFENWWNQGVMLYNASLTVEEGKPGSHSEIWKPFNEVFLSYLGKKRPDLFYFLWGREAQTLEPLINGRLIIKNRHPMMCSSKYDDDFLKSDCFLKTVDVIKWY